MCPEASSPLVEVAVGSTDPFVLVTGSSVVTWRRSKLGKEHPHTSSPAALSTPTNLTIHLSMMVVSLMASVKVM